ncbi:hypothetical protein KI387_038964, partial [Taxus chinensis]
MKMKMACKSKHFGLLVAAMLMVGVIVVAEGRNVVKATTYKIDNLGGCGGLGGGGGAGGGAGGGLGGGGGAGGGLGGGGGAGG